VETTPLRAQSNAPRDESIIASLEADTNEETDDNEDSVSEDDDLPVVVPGRPPGWNMADYLNGEYDEENRLLRDTPLSESTPFNSLDIEIAATNLYNAKEDFKKLSAKRRIKVAEHALREAREDISIVNTSDIQDEFNHEIGQRDYSIGIDLRVYINKRKVISQTLHDMTRRSFDLGVVEDQFHDQIVKYTDDEPFTFETCTAFVKSMSGRGRQLSHQFDDFSITETLKVLDLIDNKREAHPGTALCVLFEIKVACEALISKKKRTAISTAQQPQDPISIPSSPPVLPTQTRSTRTTQLLEEAAIREARRDRILTAGDFQRQLMQKYQCNDRNCTNYNNFCFPDPMDNTQHYNILATQHELWANRIASGGATIENPPDELKQYWKKKQGSINRDSRQPVKKNNAQIMEQFMEMQTKIYEQQMQYRLMEQMEAMQEKQERRDEEKERRHLLQEQRDLLTQTPHQTAYSLPRRSTTSPSLLSFKTDKTPARFEAIPATPTPRPRSSSSIDSNEDEYDTLAKFFTWKINSIKNQDRKKKWEDAQSTIFANDWSIRELRQMEDDKTPAYQRAIKAGISDGLARGFKRELRQYRQFVRRVHDEHAAAMALGALGGGNSTI
jgi:hypothetical protein